MPISQRIDYIWRQLGKKSKFCLIAEKDFRYNHKLHTGIWITRFRSLLKRSTMKE